MYHLQAQQKLEFDTQNTEVCFVIIAGKATFKTATETFIQVGNRSTPLNVSLPMHFMFLTHNLSLFRRIVI
ncbi:KduI/IolB family [Rodentibacter pneumotropicus]|uniref:KduI/IolB family n=1 Tax=Rodentibacter pneumotropicus TaxID=758 RepID=A0A3S4XVX6_9PAST|nr:KduI/IolB family [Rodentibacter pneumotropicus]